MELAYIPSPSQGVWHIGPIPIRAYALCILAGIAAALWLTRRRWVKLGGNPDDVLDIALWAVPFGIVGGRLYHVITDPELYFKAGEQPIRALYIWDGGLGIWGAVALGAVGAWIGCRRKGVPLSGFADALAPGLILAQAIGRWGNYFNQELYGDPTKLPWGLLIDPAHRPPATPSLGVYQPTFLYESIWDIGCCLLLLWADRRWSMHSARLFALYAAAYTAGRGWIEALRDDHANRFLGLRLNDWTSLVVFLVAVAFLIATRNKPAPENPIGRSRITDPDAAAPVDAEADSDAAVTAAEPREASGPDAAEGGGQGPGGQKDAPRRDRKDDQEDAELQA
ncbi:prolipoprotein diacylglyceryl transferase [Streptacidiphilus sp. PB12-B1b]|uniref:prolipoprotein diacylglyceryl transferase n=1 Tax=Streptacidiphilus sp. PB12-B1b TaxID=2705012 RepID=UPI0015F7ECFF|nr:prolipoprotein diacylglyceryl transferase [Streptacidiphilus sp. PB12-B1b]QMU76189.1 prolipoprotein diacylglyceryl transferase [Streptacidiphilus sp. PB12-B1b]